MKKYSVLILLLFSVSYTVNLSAEDVEPVFESLRCDVCHKLDTGRVNPSLKEISSAYKGDKDRLISYLQGKADPIVNKEKSKLMTIYLKKTKALTEDKLQKLADYILSK